MGTAIVVKRATRLARSNHRVTQGCVYPMLRDGTIIDDKGNSMTPCIDKPGYWLIEEVSATCDLDLKGFQDGSSYGPSQKKIYASSQVNDVRVGLRIKPEITYGINPFTESKVMNRSQQLTIRKVTLINDLDATKYNTGDIITLIQQEEVCRKTLTDLDPAIFEKSEAIKKLVAKHTKNIQDLLEVLDQLPTE